jgi:general stress protein 26
MATQKRAAGADFWFVTADGMPKLSEISGDPRVNLSYYRDRTKEWVSISGEAVISRDRAKIRELWAPDWKIWFPEEDGRNDGGPDDPRMVLLGVHARTAQYMTADKPQPLVLFEIVKGMVTRKMPKLGDVKELALRGGQSGSRRPAASSQRPVRRAADGKRSARGKRPSAQRGRSRPRRSRP